MSIVQVNEIEDFSCQYSVHPAKMKMVKKVRR